ncbi:hypothetical protein R84981_002050 [Carnimonas sp. R-84981]
MKINGYQPKGSMCLACARHRDDCSSLEFARMRPITKYPDGVIAVKCTEFKDGNERVNER